MPAGRDRTRFLVRVRDNFTCQDCGLRRSPLQAKRAGRRLFDVHHLGGVCGKKSRGYDKVSDMPTLVTLCHRCHFNRHDWAGRNSDFMVRMKNLANPRREKILRLRRSGLTMVEIGRKYGISKQRVHQLLTKALSTAISQKQD